MSLAQGFPSTFSNTEETREVLHNLDNETKKIYTDVNNIMAAGGHAHTGNGNDGAKIDYNSLDNAPDFYLKTGGKITGVIDESVGTNIASAATINLTTATGNLVHITGTTTITTVTLDSGMRREVIFDGALTLTHHATNNNLPGGANIVTVAGDRASYWSDGTTVYCTHYQRADGSAISGKGGVQGSYKNLKITNGGTANTQVAVTADQVILFNTSNLSYLVTNVSVTISTASSGANGIDAGSVANSTWYSAWLIYNGTTVAGLLSTSATAPTLPSGYTYKARVGWVRTDSSGILLRTLQLGRKTTYVVTTSTNTSQYPQMASGAAGTFTAIAITSFVPTTASQIGIIGYTTNGYEIQVAPNANHVSPAVPFSVSAYGAGVTGWDAGWIALESSSIYYKVAGGAPVLWCQGWEDNL